MVKRIQIFGSCLSLRHQWILRTGTAQPITLNSKPNFRNFAVLTERGLFTMSVRFFLVLLITRNAYKPLELPTTRSKVFVEDRTVSQLLKNFPVFYGERKFIAEFTAACDLPLFCPWLVHSTTSNHILTLPFHLRLYLPTDHFLQAPLKSHVNKSLFPQSSAFPVHLIHHFIASNNASWRAPIMKLSIIRLSPTSCFFQISPKYLFTPYSRTSSAYIPPFLWGDNFHIHIEQTKL